MPNSSNPTLAAARWRARRLAGQGTNVNDQHQGTRAGPAALDKQDQGTAATALRGPQGVPITVRQDLAIPADRCGPLCIGSGSNDGDGSSCCSRCSTLL